MAAPRAAAGIEVGRRRPERVPPGGGGAPGQRGEARSGGARTASRRAAAPPGSGRRAAEETGRGAGPAEAAGAGAGRGEAPLPRAARRPARRPAPPDLRPPAAPGGPRSAPRRGGEGGGPEEGFPPPGRGARAVAARQRGESGGWREGAPRGQREPRPLCARRPRAAPCTALSHGAGRRRTPAARCARIDRAVNDKPARCAAVPVRAAPRFPSATERVNDSHGCTTAPGKGGVINPPRINFYHQDGCWKEGEDRLIAATTARTGKQFLLFQGVLRRCPHHPTPGHARGTHKVTQTACKLCSPENTALAALRAPALQHCRTELLGTSMVVHSAQEEQIASKHCVPGPVPCCAP